MVALVAPRVGVGAAGPNKDTVIIKSNNPDFPAGTEFVEGARDGGGPGGAGDG